MQNDSKRIGSRCTNNLCMLHVDTIYKVDKTNKETGTDFLLILYSQNTIW